MSRKLFKNALVVNEGQKYYTDLLVKDNRFVRIDKDITDSEAEHFDLQGKLLLPGIIDDQVHFREPGLTHKATIYTESRAAAMGGITTYMEMPNTKPATLTQKLLQDKYDIAKKHSFVNYSFFMGASNDNIDEVLRTDPKTVCGLKVFMGSSTGNMLVDDETALANIFKNAPLLVATHCEDEHTVRANTAVYLERYGTNIPFDCHPKIRNVEACYLSSSSAVRLAKKYNTRLHILHISTAKELELFRNDIPLSEKRITSEVCVHHLSFSSDDYNRLGAKLKCNPAIKEKYHQDALWAALKDDRLDIVATDHAPHTAEEKSNPYLSAPAGLPLIQHSLYLMLDAHEKGKISLEKMVEKMSHAPAICFQIIDRGFIREGYYADFIILEPEQKWTVHHDNIKYKCAWSPLDGYEFTGKVLSTWVNGQAVYQHNQKVMQAGYGMRLTFDRD